MKDACSECQGRPIRKRGVMQKHDCSDLIFRKKKAKFWPYREYQL